MARPFLTNPLQLKPRKLRSQGSGSSSPSQEDFEPRFLFYIEEVRRSWPGGAPASWKEAIRSRQWPSAFPGIHWAAAECLLELGRTSRGGPKEITLAWQTLALGAVHVIVDGGGLPPGIPKETLSGLLKRAGECLPPFDRAYGVGVISTDNVTQALNRLAQHPEVHTDTLRAGFVKVLKDVLEFRQRLTAPAGTDLLSALHHVLIRHPEICNLALQLSVPEPPQARFVSRSPGVPSDEPDALLQSLLQMAEQVGSSGAQMSARAGDSPRLKQRERTQEGGRREESLSYPSQVERGSRYRKRIPAPVQRGAAGGRRRSSDLKTESAWGQSESEERPSSNRLSWMMLTILGTCLLIGGVTTASQWARKARDTGQGATERVSGLPNPLDTVDAFANASTVDERIALLQDPSDEEAARAHFARVGEDEFHVDYVQALGNGRAGGLSFHASRIRFRNGISRLVAVITDPQTGRLSIDWHAYARTTSVPWSTIMQGGGDGATIRAFVKRGDYYNFAFEDSDRYACYQIIWPDTDEMLYGYVRIGTRRHALLEEVLVSGRRQRMVLRLRSPSAHAEPIQYWVDEAIANDWVLDPSGSLERSAFATDVGSRDDFSRGPVWGPSR